MKKYLLLGSRVALGVYVPAVLLLRRLREEGHQVDFLYLEELYVGKDDSIEKNKLQFHKNFKLARAGHVLPNRNVSSVDAEKKKTFFNKCIEKDYDSIVVFSGFWLSILKKFVEQCPFYTNRIKAIHMDATYSNSWKYSERSFVKEEWLFNIETKEIRNLINHASLIESEDRNDRIVVHGGGWGMGEYASKIQALNDLGYKLDIILYYEDELDEENTLNDYYLLDPKWKPNKEKIDFPRLMIYSQGKWVEYAPDDGALGSPILSLIRKAKAVLSKPGGGTLLDSMISGTPIIFSEELASYEKTNKELWQELGFGIDYYDWMKEGDKDLILERMTDDMQKIVSNVFSAEV